MNKLKRKLKKSNRLLRWLYYLISIIYIVTFLYFLKSILSLKGIETLIRIGIIVFFILYFIIYVFYNLLNLLQRKYKVLIITSLISLIFIAVFSYGGYYINYVYNSMDNLTEDEQLTYTSYLITLNDTDFSSKLNVGIISEDVSDDYELANALYKENDLSNEIVEYEDYIKMLDDLYSGEVDSIIVPGNYLVYFNEDFPTLDEDSKVIYEYSETKDNEDLVISSTKDFDEPLTFLLLGVDSESEGLNANAGFNGDTLMVVTFNPDTLETLMVSIPRDTYVPIACKNNSYAKINSSAAYGTSCVINTVSNFLDIDIDYYVKINFKGVVELVDALGGIDVDVEEVDYNTYNGQMCEQDSNRLYGKNIVCVNSGYQTLTGEQALAYARNRHLYAGGDLDRVRHQQQVVEAIASKALQFSSISDFKDIIDAISNNIATNMDVNTMLSGYSLIKKMIGNVIEGNSALNLTKAYLETYSLYVYVESSERNTSAQGYYTDSLNDIKKALKVVLGEESEDAIKTFSFDANTTYEKTSPGKNKRSGSSNSLLPDFVGKSVEYAQGYCDKNDIDLTVKYVDSDSDYYNSDVEVGLIGYQTPHKEVLLSSVSSMTVYVVNEKLNDDEEEEEEDTNKNTLTEDDEEESKTDTKSDTKTDTDGEDEDKSETTDPLDKVIENDEKEETND